MGGSFIGLVGGSRDARRRFRAQCEALRPTNGKAFALDELGPLLIGSHGLERERRGLDALVLGPAFARDDGVGTEATAALENASAPSPAARFVREAWGAYVAVFVSPDASVDICRAPLGALPCYFRPRGGALLVASGPRWLQRFAAEPVTIDRKALARHLAFAHLRLPETCLTGVTELPGGQCLTIAHGSVRQREVWSPWPWAHGGPTLADPERAASAVRAAARTCVAAQARSSAGVLLKLSGGLDSSIVAACLAHAGIPFRALTLVTDDATGDEREYARMVARHFGVELAECRRDPARVEPGSTPARDLARPSIPLFRQESQRLAWAEARTAGLSLLMDGGGGDNVFCSLQSASPVADCILGRAGWRHIGATAASVAEIAHVAVTQVLRAGAARAMRRRRNPAWPADVSLLNEEAGADLQSRPAHPWLHPPARIPPGRAAHVRLIAAGQSYVEGLDPERDPPLAVPLLAQPLVELCLRVPSWLWFERGLNRAIARRAFAGELPAAIVQRRSKGTPDGFVAQLFERNRSRIREDLLDGALAGMGLLDIKPLARVLTGAGLLTARHLNRVMTLYDAELWCRAWLT
jgi:asparagine synthase (glutamine-hydrolysing)